MNPKLIYYLLIIFACFCNSLFSNNELQFLAEKQYADKNYKQAIESYETLIKQGYTSFKLHYNLGNAYYKNNEVGLAIYHYELANKINPNSEDVKINLHLANEKTIDKIESSENFFVNVLK